MKKIINNKLYDSSTAKEIGTWDNGIYGDINSIEETLYRKKTGEFFLHGSGGANTKYASQSGSGNWSDGERIIPMTADAAAAWAQERLPADVYVSVFGAPEDDTETLRVSVSGQAAAKLRAMAAESRRPMSSIVEDLINGSI